MIALRSICIALACPLCDELNEPVDKYHLRNYGVLHGDTESLRYWEARDLLGSHELFDAIVTFVSLYISACLHLFLFITPAIRNNNK
ncbi:hypothetical protein NPIL_615511 [Nephila pilipes]|uniref:Uncharacterized protein n=1 Tax=Nephila pilipes TaxID=299642 RepID=A0A8X6QI31_NEPPI|nr:hypothetical protein NPIL_51501 [Nephila pilipes]GFU14706.1 hypothetical protein NPIL_96631 [Nephila pilipes]GFU48325.1 hypothetical protein NPIL_615511 [Nephila pilipes]